MKRLIIKILCVCAALSTGCLASCSKADGGSASDSVRGKDTASAVVRDGDYDPARAKALCDKYGSGMLSASDYTDIIEMVRVSYRVLGDKRDSLLDVAQTGTDFYNGSYVMQDSWREQYPYAEFLAKIMVEATPEAMGEANAKAWQTLDTEMSAKMKAYEETRVKRFGQYN